MGGYILFGRDRQISEIPRQMWEGHLAGAPDHSKHRLSFMSEDHHRVRYFVVRELPAHGAPIEPGMISQALQLPLEQVGVILDELEKNLVFLVRDEQEAVAWAFPVTVEPTPHRLEFSTGEQLYAA